ncbi:MAG: tetratricopeptide repeat protein [Candidatus Obscuribacterales bacterium]|nr:tetratricopeptide repeat protein [Candidatus Obscuribacterales bacterium]
MILSKKYQCCLATIFALTICSVSAQEASLLNNCERLYQANKIDEAKAALEQMLLKYPQDASAHYLLGNVFVRLQQKTKALIEYSSAMQLDKTGTVANFARTGINSLTEGSGVDSTSTANASNMPVSADRDQQFLRKSVQDISHQTDKDNLVGSAEYNARIKEIREDNDRTIKRLQSEWDEKKAQLTSDGAYYLRNSLTPRYTNAARYQVRDLDKEYQNKMQMARMDTNKKIADAQRNFNVRQSATEDSAIGIERTYASGQTNNNVKLMPLGTNMYNRNYQTMGDPSGSPIPVSAPPAKSLTQH